MRDRRRTFALCLIVVAGGCRLATFPVTKPVCIAQDAYGREVQCPAPPDPTYEGGRCTCMLETTREVFVGRVRDVPDQ